MIVDVNVCIKRLFELQQEMKLSTNKADLLALHA